MKAVNVIRGIYAVIDSSYVKPDGVAGTAEVMLNAGIRLIQLRAKGWTDDVLLNAARVARGKTSEAGAVLIINDRADIALLTDADGVHLGQDDLPVEAARRLLGKGKIIGISTHDMDEALIAASNGADYISFGPVFDTATKKDAQRPKGLQALSEICSRASIPVVAVGGVSEANLKQVFESGASSAAIISDLLHSCDITEKITRLRRIADGR